MRGASGRALLLAGLLVTLLLAGVLSFYASGHPDGLEFVAEKAGFSQTAQDHASSGTPFADYTTKGVADERLSGGLAGVVGVIAVGLLGGGLAWGLRRRSGSVSTAQSEGRESQEREHDQPPSVSR
jgi:hypothetical protein